MQVSEVKLRQILEGTKQYQVPLYQRTYSWQKKQHERIWNDILDLSEARKTNPSATHFTGSLVLAIGSVGAGASNFLVVDGQQRLTTLTLLLAALRDLLSERFPTEPMKSEALHDQLLVNKYSDEASRLKVLPTQGDRAAYLGVIDGQLAGLPKSLVYAAYAYFKTRLAETLDVGGLTSLEHVSQAVLDGLDFVSITADSNDNVYRIFESLNNTGLSLTQGDLLRNYLFMKLGPLGEGLYTSTWMPMQNRLTPKDLEQLFWIELSWSTSEVKQGDIYAGQVMRLNALNPEQVKEVVVHFNELSVLLATMRDPQKEADAGIRFVLGRLLTYGMTSTDPLVLRILELRRLGIVTAAAARDALAVLESFLVRRLLVNAPHNALSRIMLRASDELDETDLASSLRRYLSFGRKRYATDDQIAKAVVQEAFYYAGKPGQRKTILTWLERAIAGNEPAELMNTSIEHVMPQNMSLWRSELESDLGDYENVDAMHEALVHTLANLTLTGYNSELSNKPFDEKRPKLAESNIALNQEIAVHEQWGRKQILERGARIANLVATTWIPPLESADNIGSAIIMGDVAEVLSSIPVGQWASYGDIASLIGSSPAAIEDFLSSNSLSNAWRVLKASGATGSHKFEVPEGSSSNARNLLEAEGIEFDQIGHALPSQRISVDLLIDGMRSLDQADSDADLDVPTTLEVVSAKLASLLSPPTWVALESLLQIWSGAGGIVLVSAASDSSAELILADGWHGAPGLVAFAATPAGHLRVSFERNSGDGQPDVATIDEVVELLEFAFGSPSGRTGPVARSWSSSGRVVILQAFAALLPH